MGSSDVVCGIIRSILWDQQGHSTESSMVPYGFIRRIFRDHGGYPRQSTIEYFNGCPNYNRIVL